MPGRYTPPEPERDDVSTLRQRNPVVWWVALISAVALFVGATGGTLLLILF